MTDDLFSGLTVPEPAPVPEYGTISLQDERTLFDTDRAAWLRYVSRRRADQLLAGNAESIQLAWQYIGDDYKRAIWAHLTKPEREIFRAALGQLKEAA